MERVAGNGETDGEVSESPSAAKKARKNKVSKASEEMVKSEPSDNLAGFDDAV